MADLPPLHALTLATTPTSPPAARAAVAGRQARRDAAVPYARPTPPAPASPEERPDATAPREVDTCGDESDLSEDQARDLAVLRLHWKSVLESFQLWDSPQKCKFDETGYFTELQRESMSRGFRACASLDCTCGVWPLNEKYFEWNDKNPGWKRYCRQCKATVQDYGSIEDEAMRWLKERLEGWFPGIEVEVLPELRHADFAVRFQDWPEQMYLPVQLKSDGRYLASGRPKANDTQQCDPIGIAKFKHCEGYANLLIMFVKTRIEAEIDYRTLWWAWGEQVKTRRGETVCAEDASGRLGNIVPPPLPWVESPPMPLHRYLGPRAELSELYTMLRNPGPARLQSFREIWLDIRHKYQRKEMAGMLAMEQVGEVKYPKGYSTAVDCWFLGQPTQVKTYSVTTGSVSTVRGSGSANERPYSSADGIQQLVELVIVKSGEAFYLLYAMQQLEALIEHGVFAHGDSRGKSEIRVPLGRYRMWLTGKRHVRTGSSWLLDPEHGFRLPVRLRETDYLSRALLEEVAYTAKHPEWMPPLV